MSSHVINGYDKLGQQCIISTNNKQVDSHKNKPDLYIKTLKTNNLSHLSNSTYAKTERLKLVKSFVIIMR